MTNPPTASVVICAHTLDRLSQLKAAITSVLGQDLAPHEVIVVIDNNPLLQQAVSGLFAGVIVIENLKSRGLSGARNTGADHATGEIVAFLDDDAEADPDWLRGILSHYKDPCIIGVGGLVVPVWQGERPSWLPIEFDWVVGCSYQGLPRNTTEVRNLIGCNMSFRLDLIRLIGGFREDLGREGDNAYGCEETELCIRAHGVFPDRKILYDPSVIVRHKIASSRTEWRYFRSRCIAEGKSKASVVSRVGSSRGLASEIRYTLSVLPKGIVRGLADATLRRDLSGLLRASAILTGLGYVSAGYGYAKWKQAKGDRNAGSQFAPIHIAEIDLSEPGCAGDNHPGSEYGGLYCLVRSSGKPIRVVQVPLLDQTAPLAALRNLLSAGNNLSTGAVSSHVPERPEAALVSIVVATRDRPQRLEICLNSLLRQTHRNTQIVVVDNAPTSNETADLVTSRFSSAERISYLREDLPGLGHAHNQGVRKADGSIIAFTDDDVVVDARWASAIARSFAESPGAGCVTGLILPAELDTHAQYWTEQHGGFGKGFERRTYDLKSNHPGSRLFPYSPGIFGSGANMAFQRRALQSIGGFDPALGAGTPARGGDDLAAFVAIIRKGHQLVYEPGAIVWHHHRRHEAGMRGQAFGYGVGLGAVLTKLIVDEPSVAVHFLQRSPAAAYHLFSPHSEKNRRLPHDYPSTLVWRERLGILIGAPAYLRSRIMYRQSNLEAQDLSATSG